MKSEVKFEIEINRFNELACHIIKLRKIEGNPMAFREISKKILSNLNSNHII